MAIYERRNEKGKPRYGVRVESTDPVTGKRQRIGVGTFATKREAEKAEAKAITERERGTLLSPDTTTVGGLLDSYLQTEVPKTVRPENRGEYESIIRKHLKPALGSVMVRKLTAEHVDRLYADLQAKGYSSTTIKKCDLRLSAALNLAIRWNLIHTNVCDSVKPPKLDYKKGVVWTPDEVAAFLAEAEDDPLYPYWLLLVETGARTSELLGVMWSDVDFERGTLRLGAQVVRLLKGTPFLKQGGKTEAGRRTIRLTGETIDELKTYRRGWLERKLAAGPGWNPANAVFCSPAGNLLNATNVRRAFDRIVRDAGVTPITPRSVRKTHITTAIENGGKVKAVAARVGHKDIATTLATYTALTAGMDDELMDIVETLVPHRKRNAG